MVLTKRSAASGDDGSCVLKASVDRVSVDTLGRYGDRQSADISTDTRSICRPRLGRYIDRHQPTRMSADTRPILHRHSAATWPILYRHRRPTLRSFVQLSLLSSIFSSQVGGAFSGRRPFLALNPGNIHVFFSSYVFSSSPLFYTTLVTFGSSSIWGSLLTEVRYFRGAKNDVKSWYDRALFRRHG